MAETSTTGTGDRSGAGEPGTAVLGGGCFWCLDAAYRQIEGVTDVVCGYAGGHVESPSYEQVCTGRTGHAEVVRLTFDPTVIDEPTILDIYFTLHDPTTLNRQGNDIGPQYRSIMFARDAAQRERFQQAIGRAHGWWSDPIVTVIEPLTEFFPAEEYHQDYFAKNPDQSYCQVVVSGKVAKVRARFADRLRPEPLRLS